MIKCGDIFLVKGTGWIGRVINFWQSLNSLDNKSKYSHTGIILNEQGKTIEALWTGIKYGDLHNYLGQEVLIVRYNKMDPEIRDAALAKIRELKGKPYPYWRLILHTSSIMRKWSGLKIPVCSEIVKYFMRMIRNSDESWWGYNPDRLHDDFKIDKDFDPHVYEGELNSKVFGSK
ncbi:hypothetical protein LCGC14_0359090 [marine sediment metagenome]|uniref:Uncharacterized protein n=1 Tax=marine sediment metagenome TaxID=412755 RepID=A0A0F9TE60_9ZZZZ|nr:hypothetical protein [Candidatus Aminicenantes bacterium]